MHGGPAFTTATLLKEDAGGPGPMATISVGSATQTISTLWLRDAAGRKKAKSILRKLSERMFADHAWASPLPANPALAPGAHEIDENPWIPSGYTYLLQFIAHDMVDTIAMADGTDLTLQNARLRPLLLDTLYGLGPTATAAPYQLDDAQKGSFGLVPRGRFRMGRIRRGTTINEGCPFRDIGRAETTTTTDGAHATVKTNRWTEALVADNRNDDHALISQTTALWHMFHNVVIADIEAQCDSDEINAPEHSHRRFLAARHAVTAVYQAIVETDVLARILDPAVYRRYVSDNAALLSEAGPSVPREFSHGAFRFGHAMTRDNYAINSLQAEGLKTADAFNLSSRHAPLLLPITPDWVVEWDLFFEGGAVRPNLSHRIAPHYPRVFDQSGLFFPSADDGKGLAERDLRSAALGQLPKVSVLYADFAARAGLGSAMPDYATFAQPMDAWLTSKMPDAAERAIVVADPPMPYFVMFEAAHGPGAGRHLGPFGSLIVAEAMFRALRAFKAKLGGANTTLRQRISGWWRSSVR